MCAGGAAGGATHPGVSPARCPCPSACACMCACVGTEVTPCPPSVSPVLPTLRCHPPVTAASGVGEPGWLGPLLGAGGDPGIGGGGSVLHPTVPGATEGGGGEGKGQLGSVPERGHGPISKGKAESPSENPGKSVGPAGATPAAPISPSVALKPLWRGRTHTQELLPLPLPQPQPPQTRLRGTTPLSGGLGTPLAAAIAPPIHAPAPPRLPQRQSWGSATLGRGHGVGRGMLHATPWKG